MHSHGKQYGSWQRSEADSTRLAWKPNAPSAQRPNWPDEADNDRVDKATHVWELDTAKAKNKQARQRLDALREQEKLRALEEARATEAAIRKRRKRDRKKAKALRKVPTSGRGCI